MSGPLALSRVRELGADADQIATLPLEKFVSLNRLSGGTLAGEVC